MLRGTIAFAAGGNPFGTQGAAAGNVPQTIAQQTAPFNGAANVAGVPTVASTVPVTLSAFGTGVTAGTTVALPVGMIGAPITPSNGIILGTTNGGFSWVPQTLASFNYTCTAANTWGIQGGAAAAAPFLAATQLGAFNVATVTGGSFCSFVSQPVTATAIVAVASGSVLGLATNWQAYNPQATQIRGTIPKINGLAFTSAMGKYNGWAVGNSGLVYMTSFAMTAVTNSINTPITTWTVVSGSAITSSVYLTTGFLNLYGITWCAPVAVLLCIYRTLRPCTPPSLARCP